MTYYAIWKSTTGNSNMASIITDSDMFKGDEQLSGSNGTGYNSLQVDSKMSIPMVERMIRDITQKGRRVCLRKSDSYHSYLCSLFFSAR